MSAQIWNTYDLALASGIGVLVGAVPVAALMILKRWDGSREAATARGWWNKAIAVQEANDRARWAPAYGPNLCAIESDPDVTGDVVAVEVHDVDEDAPQDDTDRQGVVRVLLALPRALWDRLCDAVADWRATRRERDQVGTGELLGLPTQAEDIRTQMRSVGYTDEDIAAEIAELTGEINPPYEPRHWNDATAMHGILTPGRHRAEMPINVPAQRDGGEDL